MAGQLAGAGCRRALVCRSRLAVIRRDGVPGDRSGRPAPDPKWAIADSAAGATSAHHRPSAAAPPPTLHQVVRRAVSPAVLGRRAVSPGAFSGRVLLTSIPTLRLFLPRFEDAIDRRSLAWKLQIATPVATSRRRRVATADVPGRASSIPSFALLGVRKNPSDFCLWEPLIHGHF